MEGEDGNDGRNVMRTQPSTMGMFVVMSPAGTSISK